LWLIKILKAKNDNSTVIFKVGEKRKAMWFKHYRDYPIDKPLIKERVEPSHGIIGCEMHELNGWGNEYHIPRKIWKKGLISSFFARLLRGRKKRHG
jgi:hypothetical protein